MRKFKRKYQLGGSGLQSSSYYSPSNTGWRPTPDPSISSAQRYSSPTPSGYDTSMGGSSGGVSAGQVAGYAQLAGNIGRAASAFGPGDPYGQGTDPTVQGVNATADTIASNIPIAGPFYQAGKGISSGIKAGRDDARVKKNRSGAAAASFGAGFVDPAGSWGDIAQDEGNEVLTSGQAWGGRALNLLLPGVGDAYLEGIRGNYYDRLERNNALSMNVEGTSGLGGTEYQGGRNMTALRQQQMPIGRYGGLKKYQTGGQKKEDPWQTPGASYVGITYRPNAEGKIVPYEVPDSNFIHSTTPGSTRWVTKEGNKTPFQDWLSKPNLESNIPRSAQDTLIKNDPRVFNIKDYTPENEYRWAAPESRSADAASLAEAFNKTYGRLSSLIPGNTPDKYDEGYLRYLESKRKQRGTPEFDMEDGQEIDAYARFRSKATYQTGGEFPQPSYAAQYDSIPYVGTQKGPQLYNDPFADKKKYPVPSNIEFDRRDTLLGLRDRNLPLPVTAENELGPEFDKNFKGFGRQPSFVDPNKIKNYRTGGMHYSDGVKRKNANAELENDEVVMRKGGKKDVKVKGPSHEEGGVPMNLQPGDYVWSDHLKDPETGKSMAELYEELSGSGASDQQIQQLMMYQEQLAGRMGGEGMGSVGKKGGLVKYQLGTPINPFRSRLTAQQPPKPTGMDLLLDPAIDRESWNQFQEARKAEAMSIAAEEADKAIARSKSTLTASTPSKTAKTEVPEPTSASAVLKSLTSPSYQPSVGGSTIPYKGTSVTPPAIPPSKHPQGAGGSAGGPGASGGALQGKTSVSGGKTIETPETTPEDKASWLASYGPALGNLAVHGALAAATMAQKYDLPEVPTAPQIKPEQVHLERDKGYLQAQAEGDRRRRSKIDYALKSGAGASSTAALQQEQDAISRDMERARVESGRINIEQAAREALTNASNRMDAGKFNAQMQDVYNQLAIARGTAMENFKQQQREAAMQRFLAGVEGAAGDMNNIRFVDAISGESGVYDRGTKKNLDSIFSFLKKKDKK